MQIRLCRAAAALEVMDGDGPWSIGCEGVEGG
jgi:hypothetical protein